MTCSGTPRAQERDQRVPQRVRRHVLDAGPLRASSLVLANDRRTLDRPEWQLPALSSLAAGRILLTCTKPSAGHEIPKLKVEGSNPLSRSNPSGRLRS